MKSLHYDLEKHKYNKFNIYFHIKIFNITHLNLFYIFYSLGLISYLYKISLLTFYMINLVEYLNIIP